MHTWQLTDLRQEANDERQFPLETLLQLCWEWELLLCWTLIVHTFVAHLECPQFLQACSLPSSRHQGGACIDLF